ncbi:putative membrane protein [Campylobacter cuniculorum DSM 23162 = LMG 24588]|nr:putative membrane protein [Campylobacter cuniculorum DSM 23162 = LMG 24588]
MFQVVVFQAFLEKLLRDFSNKEERMRPENYVAFFTVCGFFIGLAFSIISIDEAFDICAFTLFITFMFYVFIHIAIMNFVDIKKISGRIFNKGDYEKTSNNIINDLVIREKKIDLILEKLNEEREELRKNEIKERRRNARKTAA